MISETADCFSGFISPRKIRKDFARGINRSAAGKNHRMARIVDLTALTVITFLLTFVWTTAAFDSWAAVFAVSCAAALMAAVTAVDCGLHKARRGQAVFLRQAHRGVCGASALLPHRIASLRRR